MKTRNSWRHVRVLGLVIARKWLLGRDPRREGGVCLVSPRGTLYELRSGGRYARRIDLDGR